MARFYRGQRIIKTPPEEPPTGERPRGRGDPALRGMRVRGGGVVEEKNGPPQWCQECGRMLTGPNFGKYYRVSPRGASDRLCRRPTGGYTESCAVAYEKRWQRDLERYQMERAGADRDRMPPPLVRRLDERQGPFADDVAADAGAEVPPVEEEPTP